MPNIIFKWCIPKQPVSVFSKTAQASDPQLYVDIPVIPNSVDIFEIEKFVACKSEMRVFQHVNKLAVDRVWQATSGWEIRNKKPTNWLGQAKRSATLILPNAVSAFQAFLH